MYDAISNTKMVLYSSDEVGVRGLTFDRGFNRLTDCDEAEELYVSVALQL